MPKSFKEHRAEVEARYVPPPPRGTALGPVRTAGCMAGCGRSVPVLDAICDVARDQLPAELREQLDRAQRRGSWRGRPHDLLDRIRAEDAARVWLAANPSQHRAVAPV
jgi:hypothetical protein